MRRTVVLVFTLLNGCAVTELSPAGARVEVSTGPRPDCQFIGSARASEGSNAQSPETNIEAVQADLRNQAAARGGNLVVITSQQLGTGAVGVMVVPRSGAVVTSGCANCISMAASVYRCNGGGGEVRVPAPAASPGGCQNDAQCKGDRICQAGTCVDPPRPPTAPPGGEVL